MKKYSQPTVPNDAYEPWEVTKGSLNWIWGCVPLAQMSQAQRTSAANKVKIELACLDPEKHKDRLLIEKYLDVLSKLVKDKKK